MIIRPSRGSTCSWESLRPSCGQPPVGVERAELLQQPDAVADLAAVGRVQERERLDVAEVERRHPQDHRGEAGAQDLGSVKRGRSSKSSSEYSRMAMPSDVRPQRPLRWSAEACEIGSIGSRWTFSRAL